MAKIGIMSMQRVLNYGSFLQAIALKSILEGFENHVEFVDFKQTGADNQQIYGKHEIKEKLKKCFSLLIRKLGLTKISSHLRRLSNAIECDDLFKYRFPEQFMMELGVSSDRNERPELDVLVIGSDEVFNIAHNSMDLFGDNNRSKKVISFAGSFGNTDFEHIEAAGLTDKLGECFLKFDAVSVRDKNSLNIVEKVTAQRVHPEYHLDPVFHFDYSSYMPDVKVKKPYLVVYGYSNISEGIPEAVESFAKTKGLDIYCMQGYQGGLGEFLNLNPFEVLSYIKNAEYVVTTTFHGCVMAAKFQRRMAVYIVPKANQAYNNEAKLGDLIQRLHLEKNVFSLAEDLPRALNSEIDYALVNQTITEEVRSGLEYLESNTKVI